MKFNISNSNFFSFNSYVYYIICGFIALNHVFKYAKNKPAHPLSLPTRTFNLATRALSILTREFELLTP